MRAANIGKSQMMHVYTSTISGLGTVPILLSITEILLKIFIP